MLCALMHRTLALTSYLRLPSGPPGSGEGCPAGGLIAWTLALWSQAAPRGPPAQERSAGVISAPEAPPPPPSRVTADAAAPESGAQSVREAHPAPCLGVPRGPTLCVWRGAGDRPELGAHALCYFCRVACGRVSDGSHHGRLGI